MIGNFSIKFLFFFILFFSENFFLDSFKDIFLKFKKVCNIPSVVLSLVTVPTLLAGYSASKDKDNQFKKLLAYIGAGGIGYFLSRDFIEAKLPEKLQRAGFTIFKQKISFVRMASTVLSMELIAFFLKRKNSEVDNSDGGGISKDTEEKYNDHGIRYDTERQNEHSHQMFGAHNMKMSLPEKKINQKPRIKNSFFREFCNYLFYDSLLLGSLVKLMSFSCLLLKKMIRSKD